jgi:hypothetical protein
LVSTVWKVTPARHRKRCNSQVSWMKVGTRT